MVALGGAHRNATATETLAYLRPSRRRAYVVKTRPKCAQGHNRVIPLSLFRPPTCVCVPRLPSLFKLTTT